MDKNKKIEEATEAIGINESISEEEEFDFVAGFLKAAETVNETLKKIEIRRNGALVLKFSIHPISAPEMRVAKKKATTYMPNPVNKKMPPIEKERDQVKYESYLIYLATVDEDKKKLWDNPDFKQRFNVMEGYELVDKVLLPGEKDSIIDIIDSLSGFGDNGIDNDIDTAKN